MKISATSPPSITDFLLPLRWTYSTVSKVADFRKFSNKMHEQLLWPFLHVCVAINEVDDSCVIPFSNLDDLNSC